MSRIHLVRHGQTNWNLERRIQGQTNSQLTELGRQQAQEVGERLKDIPFNAVYASTSDRARDTAEIILRQHSKSKDLSLLLRDELREIALGPWEGRLYEEIKEEDEEGHGHFWQNPALFKREGAESFYDLQERAVKEIEGIAARHPGQEVLVVSHGAFIKSVLCHLEDRHLSQFWLPPTMNNCCHSIINVKNTLADGKVKFVIEQYAGLASW